MFHLPIFSLANKGAKIVFYLHFTKALDSQFLQKKFLFLRKLIR